MKESLRFNAENEYSPAETRHREWMTDAKGFVKEVLFDGAFIGLTAAGILLVCRQLGVEIDNLEKANAIALGSAFAIRQAMKAMKDVGEVGDKDKSSEDDSTLP